MSLPDTAAEDTRPTKPCQKFQGHNNVVVGVIHLPGGQQIMTSSYGGSLRIWNLQTGEQISHWDDENGRMWAIALSGDGKKIVSGSDDSVVRLWSIEIGRVIAEWTGHTGEVESVCWNGDGERILSGSWDGTARVWDVETGNTVLEINTGLGSVYTAIFSPDSTLIATGGYSPKDELIKIWDANTGKLVSILKGHTGYVNCLAWTANRSTLISGSDDQSIRTWDTSTWQQIAVFTGHTGTVSGIAISPNGRILASASRDKTAQLWNLQNGQLIGSPLQHPSYVNCVAFSTDGTLLATGCDNRSAYTWDVAGIIEDAGLKELLGVEKSFLHANATRRPLQQPKTSRIVPTGFFSESPQHPDPAIIRPISPPPEPLEVLSVPDDAPPEIQPSSPERTQHRFFKWVHPVRPTFLSRARLHFFPRQTQHDEGVELQEGPPSIVDVPLAKLTPRNVSKWDMINKKKREEEAKKKREAEAKKKKIMEEVEAEKVRQARIASNTDAATTSQLPTQNNTVQLSAGPSQPRRSSNPQPLPFPSPSTPLDATPPAAIMSSTAAPDARIIRAGCCTPFLHCIGSVFAQHPNGH